MMKKEKNYDFLDRRREVHLPGRRDIALAAAENEVEIDGRWMLAANPPEDPMLQHAILDLQDYFLVSMGISLKIAVHGIHNPDSKMILLEKDIKRKKLGRGIYSMEVGNGQVRICSSDARAVWFGALHLEDVMNLREAPFVGRGTVVSKPCVEVR